MYNGYTTNGNICNVIYKSTWCTLSLCNIRYLFKKLGEDSSGHDAELLDALSSVNVWPSHLLDKASECLLFQCEHNYEQFVKQGTEELEKLKYWNNIPRCQHLKHREAALQSQEYDLIDNYEYIYSSSDMFRVRNMKSKREKINLLCHNGEIFSWWQ